MLSRKILIGICFFMMLGVGLSVGAEESKFQPKKGWYVGVSGVYNEVNGEFDDRKAYVDPYGSFYSVPNIDGAFGVGLTIGNRNDFMATEITYQRVAHDTSTNRGGIGNQECIYNSADLNFKFEVLAKDRFRPFLLAGIGGVWMEMENARVTSSQLGDYSIYGFSLNAGAGFSYYIDTQWFISATAMYRWQRFKEIDNMSYMSDGNTMGSGLNYIIGLNYTF